MFIRPGERQGLIAAVPSHPARAGSTQYEPRTQTDLVTGGGEHMRFGTDAFHFVWKRLSGDLRLAADIYLA